MVLQDEPAIWREVEVASTASLYGLAQAIVTAFGFAFDHPFGFYTDLGQNHLRSQPRYELFADMGEREASLSVRRTKVADALPEVGQTLLFLFDYGDDWRFTVQVIGRGEREPRARYPRVLRTEGTAPEQYPPWEEEDEGDDAPHKGLH